MFKHFFFTELRYALRQPMVYIFLGLITLMVFGATSSDNIVIGGTVGSVHKNAPYVITNFTAIMSIFGLLIAVAFYNNAALRDYNNQFNEILFSTPLSKGGYFFGRFFGALILSTIPLLGVFLGVILGTLIAPAVGWEGPERFGEFHFEAFLNNYLLFILPNMFFAGAVIYAMANKWRSTVISFVGALIILMTYIISGTLLSDIDNETIGALTDMFGIRTFSIESKYLTPVEKNTLSPGFTGLLMVNRLVWVAVGAVVLLLSYFSFSFQEKKKAVKAKKEGEKAEKQEFLQPELHPNHGKASGLAHFGSFFYTNTLSITKSITFKILFLFSALILISSLVGGFEYYGLQSYPVTYKIVDLINNSAGIFVVIVLVFFSGELIWRDRDNKINEVIDATPHASLVSMVAKAFSLITVSCLLHLFFVFCGVIYQLVNGFTNIELDVYLLEMLYGKLPAYAVLSGVMITIQVLVNNKYIGYFLSIFLLFMMNFVWLALDVQTNMVSISDGPRISYSDMNGFGPGLTGALWFNLYWLLFAVVMIMGAGVLWNRGASAPFKERLSAGRKQMSRGYGLAWSGAFLAWVLVAGWVFYNTKVLNEIVTQDESELIAVEYERLYKKYENVPLPKLVDVKYEVHIFPEERNVDVKADILLENKTNKYIDSLHFNCDPEWSPEFDIPNAEVVLDNEEMGYKIFRFNKPMAPGERLEITINTAYRTKGFENDRGNTWIVRNGTFLNSSTIIPSMGYSSRSELQDKNKRRKYGLPPKDRMPELQSTCSEACMANYLSNGHSDYMPVETIISTSEDQIAIAPGSLIKEWNENGRNYYHYKVDHPSQHFYSFVSADYEVARRKWNGVDLEVYHHPGHDKNVPMMLDAIERSLAYYTENFGPYYHKQCRIIEFPRYSRFAQAFPGTMPYSESFGFIANLEDTENNNVVDAVVAHEMAHQWWAHQVVGARMQGGTMLSESFAEYSSLMTMKQISETPMKMREFLKYDHDRYLRGRSREVDNELPLLEVENQGHIHYGKGSVVLYALQDYIGEDAVNRALRGFLEEYRYKEPPYPTSNDFLRYLEPEVPDSLQYLITDWIKEITLYDNRLKEASYTELSDGKYEVSIDLEAYKIKADTIGNETQVDMNDWVDIGVFADSEEKELIYERRVKVNQPEMSFTMVVDEKPAKAAVDPRRLLIERTYSDNVKTVSEGESEP